MEPDKSLLISFENPSNEQSNKTTLDKPLEKEISLGYSDEDEEMPSDSEDVPKRKTKERDESSFNPIDDVEIFATDDTHIDTSGGECYRKTNFDDEEFGAVPNVKRYMNPRLKEETDEFSKFLSSDEQKSRRTERAKRFGLETTATDTAADPPMIDEPTAEILSKLYSFFDIDPTNPRHKSKYRLSALYLRGVDRLSTEQIFDYFGSYCPSYLEWVDDTSCNLVWPEPAAAARGLLGMSRPLRRIRPLRSSTDNEQEETGANLGEFVSPMKRSSTDQEQHFSKSDSEEKFEVVDDTVIPILENEEPIDVNLSQVAIPPGFWRVGKPSDYKNVILMRFATIDDVKIRGAQRRSRYYREHGNPNFGGQTGIISRSYMDRTMLKRKRVANFDDRPSDTGLFVTDLRKTINDKERWNLLREDAYRNPELEPGELVEEKDLETGEVKLTYFSSDDEDVDERSSKRRKMRMRADEEEDKKADKRRRLRQLKMKTKSGGIEGDWRSAQRSTNRDLRDVLKESRIRVTVNNEKRSTKDDLRRRLGKRQAPDEESDDF